MARVYTTLEGLDVIRRVQVRLRRLTTYEIDAGAPALMTALMKVIADDNRRGVLAGTDKAGRPMTPVTYRPRDRRGRPMAKGAPLKARQRNYRHGTFVGRGYHPAGLNNNLSREEYSRLGGPPLAPRGPHSRVITNLVTQYERPRPGYWVVYGYWRDVVSDAGVPFLRAHFEGQRTGRRHRSRLPVRDLCGLRPQGRTEAIRAFNSWSRDLVGAYRFLASGRSELRGGP